MCAIHYVIPIIVKYADKHFLTVLLNSGSQSQVGGIKTYTGHQSACLRFPPRAGLQTGFALIARALEMPLP